MMIQRTNLAASLALALGIAVSVPGAANAASIRIDDTSPDETFTLTVDGFDFGFVYGFALATSIPNGGSITVSETPNEGGSTGVFKGTWIGPGIDTFQLARRVFFVEAGSNLISDVFTYAIGTDRNIPVDGELRARNIVGEFVSLGDNQIDLLPINLDANDVIFFENGGAFEFSFENLIGQISSDPVTAVPEPGSLALLGLGFAGLGLARRRSRAERGHGRG